MDKNQGYEIIQAVMLENGRGFALGHNPAAPSPYVTWACYDDKDGQRQYEWGHYGSDRAALEQDFAARVQEYQRLYNVGVKQTEAPGLYKYYSTQRPVDIGTFPKPPRNAPDEIVNYDQRVPVENGAFLAWGHYGIDRAALEQDFAARVQEYQRLYKVGIVQTEAPGLYKYYSTQLPVDIGTFPKPPRNAPDEIVNYDQRIPVENGSFLAWGHLTYTRPLTKRQASDYELRPAPDNPDRPRSIREQMKTAAKQAEADRGQAALKKNAPNRGER